MHHVATPTLPRTLIHLTLSTALIGAAFPSSAAEPVELVVAYAAGGVSDLMARNVAHYLEPEIGNKIIVQNRPGAAGMIGTDHVFKANADGNTLLLARIATLAVAPALQNVPYDPAGFSVIGLIATDPFTCVTSTRKHYKTVDDLKQVLQQRPGTVTYSSSGVGSLNQFAALRLLEALGIEAPLRAAVHIPSQGEGPALTSVAGGHIDFFCGNVAPIMPQIKSGTVRALFVTSEERIEGLEDVPTAKEVGIPEMAEVVGWSALVGPPGLADTQVTLFAEAMGKMSSNQEWRSFIEKVGSVPNVLPPEATTRYIEEQAQLYKDMVERLALRPTTP